MLAEVLGGTSTVYDEEGRLLAGRRPTPPDGLADAVGATARVLGPRACAPTTAPGWPSPPPATSTSAPWCCAPTAPMELPERRTLERGALVTALVLLFGRTEAEAESRVRGELLADLLAGAAARTRSGCASGRGSRAPRSTATWPWRSPRHAVASAPGSASSAPLARELRGLGGGPRGPGGAASRRPSRWRWASAARPAAAARPSGSPRSTGGLPGWPRRWREARQTPRRAACRLGRTGEVSDPAGARAGPAAARRQRARGGRRVRRSRTIGPVLRYDARARHPAGRDPRRPGSTPAAACARPPSGCTSTPTPSPSGSTGSAGCSATTGGSRGRRLDVQLALQMAPAARP